MSDNGMYYLYCYNFDTSYALVPVWTYANDQDDLLWGKMSGCDTRGEFIIQASDHNNEDGTYIVHIYSSTSEWATGNFIAGLSFEFEG